MRPTMLASAILLASVISMGPSAWAQANAITRTELQQLEAPDSAHIVATYLVTVAPQATVARHTHPGVEMGYCMTGGGTLTIQGMPDRTIKPGDSWAIPAGVVHSVHNTSNQPEQLVVTFVVEKGKPLSTPAPQQ